MKLHDERCNICLENLLQSENLFIKLEISERSKQTQIETLSSEETYFRLLYTPCCKKWLHLTCIQQQAYNAGLYFIKCPLCNDKDLFKKAIIDNGIYIPDKDASWEESAAFHDLERRYDNCDASHCSCPKGRGHCEDVGTWELYVCALCGSNGMHLGCLPPEMQHDDAPDWVCDFCVRIERQIEQTRKSKIDPVSTLKTIRSTEPIATASNKMVIGDLKDPILVNGDVEQTTSESSVKIELPALSINSLKKEDSTMDQISVEMQLTDISNTEHVENGENGACVFFCRFKVIA